VRRARALRALQLDPWPRGGKDRAAARKIQKNSQPGGKQHVVTGLGPYALLTMVALMGAAERALADRVAGDGLRQHRLAVWVIARHDGQVGGGEIGDAAVGRLEEAVRRLGDVTAGRPRRGLGHQDADGVTGTVATDDAIGFDPLPLLRALMSTGRSWRSSGRWPASCTGPGS
jgi:hypothetical protein